METRTANDFPEGTGWGCHGDTEEPLGSVGNPACAPAVETEGKLLEVAVEMFEAHRPLMGAEDPSLEQREDQRNAGHLGRGLIELGQHRDDVAIAGLAELGIAAPAVGVSGFAIADGGCRRRR